MSARTGVPGSSSRRPSRRGVARRRSPAVRPGAALTRRSLLRKCAWSHLMTFRAGLIEAAGVVVAAGSGRGRSGGLEAGPVELEQVAGGGGQLPFGLRGGKAAAGEASDRAGVFGLPEQGLDGGGAQ